MTVSGVMASVSTWNTKLNGNQALGLREDDASSLPSRKRYGSLEKHKLNSDTSPMNGFHVDSDRMSNMQDLNSYGRVKGEGVNESGELATGEHLVDKHNIVSVTENPFFKSDGKIRSLHSRNDYRSDRVQSDSSLALSPRPMLGRENDGVFSEEQGEEEEEVEYHPGSGFVIKLLGKFKKYEKDVTKEERHPAPMKRSASLENVLGDKPTHTTSNKKDFKSVKNDSVSSVINQGNLSHRAKSVEHIGINHTARPASTKRAPDTKLARKDIVIIESKGAAGATSQQNGAVSSGKTVRASSPHGSGSGRSSPGAKTTVVKDEVVEIDELPKPNTVTNTRNLFESSRSSHSKKKAPARPVSNAAKISTVAPTKTGSTSSTSTSRFSKTTTTTTTTTTRDKAIIDVKNTTTTNRDKAVIDVKNINNGQSSHKPKETMNKSTTEVPRSTLPPITTGNKHKKPSPVVTVAPYKPKVEENDVPSSVKAPQKPVTTPRQSDRKPAPPKPRQNIISTTKEIKTSKIEDLNERNNENEKPVSMTTEDKKPVISGSDRIEDSNSGTFKNASIGQSDVIETSPSESVNNVVISPEIVNSVAAEDSNAPKKGIPTIIANRMKKENSSQGNASNIVISGTNETRKLNEAPPIPVNATVVEKTRSASPEGDSPRQNLQSSRNNDIGGPAMVFDSSMLSKKKRKPKPNSASNFGVPRLDLTSINNDQDSSQVYQEGYKPTEIKPCSIVFIGANVDTGRSSLKKGKSTKGRIKFNDEASTTHEYPSESHLIEEYVALNPHIVNEEEDFLFMDGVAGSTDDVLDLPTPRHSSDDEVLKSNTALSHSGGLSSYQSKYQTEFDWNTPREPDSLPLSPDPTPDQQDEDNMGILPAGEDDTNTWSESTTSDLLF